MIEGLTRRKFLGGSAVALSLPFLESLIPRQARAATAANLPKRLLFYWVPNGIYMQKFRPTTTGANYVMPPLLAPLEALRADLTVVTGLENAPAKPDGVGDHASGTAGFITCAHANKSQTDIRLGISADQLAVNQIGKLTRLPSLQLGIAGGSTAGDCDSGYGCAYARNVSWAGPSTPLPKLTDARTVFNQLFQGFDSVSSQAEIAKRQAYGRSVLDAVADDANSLLLKVGRTDSLKVQEYQISETPILSCSPGAPPPADLDYPTKVRIMSDLMVLAFQCDVTRVITFMLGNAVSNQTYPFLTSNGAPITRGHHDISHHGGIQTNLDMLFEIGTWEMKQLAYLLDKMKNVTEGPDGTNLLHQSTVFLSSDVSDGNRHNHDDLPVIVAGHGGGALSPGRHIAYPAANHEKISNLLLTVVGTVGASGPLGDGTGALSGI